MKIDFNNSINYKGHGSAIKNIKRAIGKNFAKIDEIGEGVNITLDFAGKAIIVPATIMLVSKEEKEKKQYSAFKNPVAATIQLLMEAPILMFCSKLVENLANNGSLDNSKSGISYNEKNAVENFIKTIKKSIKNNAIAQEKCAALFEELKKKGLTKSLKEEFENIIQNSDKPQINELKKSLSNLELTHKRLYHLENRISFLAAILLTPVMCKLEDYLFPKIMNKIITPKKNNLKPRQSLTISHFKAQVKQGAIK